MNIVTLTTDFGNRDHYLPMLKGTILSRVPHLQLVDISHEIPHHNIVQAAFTLQHSFSHFPSQTIHLVSVANYYQPNPIFIAFEHQHHYFIGADNGMFSLMFDYIQNPIYQLNYDANNLFPTKDLFANAVHCIAQNYPLEHIGKPTTQFTKRISLQPVISPSQIRGSVIYIDSYDNVIVNISKQLFEQVGKSRSFALYFKRHDPLTTMSQHYTDDAVGETVCFFNTTNLLEISINMGKAASLLGLQLDDTVQIDFY